MSIYTSSSHLQVAAITSVLLRDYITALPDSTADVFGPRCLAKFLQIHLNNASPASPLRVDGSMGTSTTNALNAMTTRLPDLEIYLLDELNKTILSVTGRGLDITQYASLSGTGSWTGNAYDFNHISDNDSNTIWLSSKIYQPTVTFEFDKPTKVFAMSIERNTASTGTNSENYSTKTWSFSGSNDGVNWTELLVSPSSEIAITINGGASVLALDHDVQYVYFRANFLQDAGGGAHAISKIKLWQSVTGETGGCLFPKDGRAPMFASKSPIYKELVTLLLAGEHADSIDPANYDVMFGGTVTNPQRFLKANKPITQMTIRELKAYQLKYSKAAIAYKKKYGKPPVVSAAAGLLQLIRATLITQLQAWYPQTFHDDVKFTPDVQDQMIIVLMWRRHSNTAPMIEKAEYRGTSPTNAEITDFRKDMAKVWASIAYTGSMSYYGVNQAVRHDEVYYDTHIRTIMDKFVNNHTIYFS